MHRVLAQAAPEFFRVAPAGIVAEDEFDRLVQAGGQGVLGVMGAIQARQQAAVRQAARPGEGLLEEGNEPALRVLGTGP